LVELRVERGISVHHVAIEIRADEWLAAWRQATKRLLVKVPGAPRLNERIALRVQFQDQPAGATVVGTAVSVEHQGYRIEMAPDAEGMKAVRLLCAAARGEALHFVEREPRYLVKLPVFVAWNGERMLTNTINISENGCALRWSGRLPTMGQRLQLRVGSGSRAHEIRSLLCWSDSGEGKLGLRIFALHGARKAWDSMLGEAAHRMTSTAARPRSAEEVVRRLGP
jgi:hypothetical protein